ncbi:MAG: DUF92 domain-containing protein [Williamsia sp.]|nr:DUF92 domain-containing protein [Williamsia sp.]
MIWSMRAKKLTPAGAVAGGLIGLLVFTGAGFTGLAMMTLFFLLGTIATSWKRELKERQGIAEENKGGRTAGQVIANAGVPALLAVGVLLAPANANLFRLMMAAGFASAAADTVSSELGNVYGSRYYNILSFKRDERGLNGVVSLEGSLFGVAASAAIACVYATGFGWNKNFFVIVLAGTLGNVLDSVLGATLERKHYLSNDGVNFFNTLAAALAALLVVYIF